MRQHLPLYISLFALLAAFGALFRPQPLADNRMADLTIQIQALGEELQNLDQLVQIHEEQIFHISQSNAKLPGRGVDKAQ